MDLLIIVKWLTPWEFTNPEDVDNRLNNMYAPSIITVMIRMFLNVGAVDPDATYLVGSDDTQKYISITLLLVTFVSVPLMLLVKPLYLRSKMKAVHSSIDNGKDYNRLDEDFEDEERKTEDVKNPVLPDVTDVSISPKHSDAINLD
jgi:hypothetical protein